MINCQGTQAQAMRALVLMMLGVAGHRPDNPVPESRQEHGLIETRRDVSVLVNSGEAAASAMTSIDAGEATVADEKTIRKLVEFEYPTSRSDALDARTRLLAIGWRAVPVILESVTGDLRDWGSHYKAWFANRLLGEIAGGHFGWRFSIAEEDAIYNKNVIDSWRCLSTYIDSRLRDPSVDAEIKAQRAPDQTHVGQEGALFRSWLAEFKGSIMVFIRIEPVMTPGMRIRARTSNGAIEIVADRGFGRRLSWEATTRFLVLLPRPERWEGSLGLFNPGAGEDWEDAGGITRGVVDEGQLSFTSDSEARSWYATKRESALFPHVCTRDGLVVGWMKATSRRQVNVNVWQVLVDGKRPDWSREPGLGSIEVDYSPSECLK